MLATFTVVLLILIINVRYINGLGFIYNASYISSSSSSSANTIITYRNTCSECICYAFFSNTPPLYVGLNCYNNNNKTCELFSNYSSASIVQSNSDSTLIFIQQPPLQNKTADYTIAGNANGTSGNGDQSLNGPVDVFLSSNETLFVADWNNNRVQAFNPGSRIGATVISMAGQPQGLFVDRLSNLYVTWHTKNQVTIRPSGINVPSTALGTCTWVNSLNDAYGVVVDSLGNIYVSSVSCSFISQWNVNQTNATMLIVNSSLVNQPRHIYLDEDQSLLYVADTLRHRILKLFLNGSLPAQTVAGINGVLGRTTDKLNSPAGVYVSRIDGTIYVADTGNHRIQKWSIGASTGITIAGNANGTSGSGMYALNGPYAVFLDSNETFFYVADYYNNRVQKFPLSS
ncbi:hypothetical protein I4U23_023186 [Adineta vaga]|nr:hypothetical protein I4U23_023186 [Adineta vaga]